MRKLSLFIGTLYLAVIIASNVYVNFFLDKQVNKRRDFFSTSWAISLVPGVFYAKDLKFNLYGKKITLKSTVTHSFVILNALALVKRKVSVLAAYGSGLTSVIDSPLPPLIRKKPPVWEYHLENISISDLQANLSKDYSYQGPSDDLDFSIIVTPALIDIQKFHWEFSDGALSQVLEKVNGEFAATYKGEKGFAPMIRHLDLRSKLTFELLSLPGLNAFANKHKLKFTTTTAKISSEFNVKDGVIEEDSFLQVEDITNRNNFKKAELKSQGDLSWSQKTKYLKLTLAPFEVFNSQSDVLLKAPKLVVEIKSIAHYLKDLLLYSKVDVYFPSFIVPEAQRWGELFLKNFPVTGMLQGEIRASMDANQKKELILNTQFEDLKVKGVSLKGRLSGKGEFTSPKQGGQGNFELNGELRPDFPKENNENTLSLKLKMQNLSFKDKTFSSGIDLTLNDNQPFLRFIHEVYEIGRVRLTLLRSRKTEVHTTLVNNPEEIVLDNLKIKLKSFRRFDGSLSYDKKN